MTEKYASATILAAVKAEQEKYQASMQEHVSKLKEERKGLQDQIGEIDDLIKSITGEEASSDKKKKRVALEDAAVLAFIGKGEKTAGEVEKEFGCSYVTATKKLKALEKSKKLVSAKDGNKTLYKVK